MEERQAGVGMGMGMGMGMGIVCKITSEIGKTGWNVRIWLIHLGSIFAAIFSRRKLFCFAYSLRDLPYFTSPHLTLLDLPFRRSHASPPPPTHRQQHS
ncbi:hypothetical protein K445DRAFT_322884 [Daldinia sp. EC12]|nr:hypothetical protein K445DRAFT_322884 [Daldinia sp. EC12]